MLQWPQSRLVMVSRFAEDDAAARFHHSSGRLGGG